MAAPKSTSKKTTEPTEPEAPKAEVETEAAAAPEPETAAETAGVAPERAVVAGKVMLEKDLIEKHLLDGIRVPNTTVVARKGQSVSESVIERVEKKNARVDAEAEKRADAFKAATAKRVEAQKKAAAEADA